MLWNPRLASKFVNDRQGHYERIPARRNVVSPCEQLQHYSQHWGTQYGFAITDKPQVVIRSKLSPSSASQRQLRQTQDMQPSGHKGILSNTSLTSDVSEAFSAMSFDPKSGGHDVGELKTITIPWNNGKGKVLTVDLALFFLVLLAQKERHPSDHYFHLSEEEKTLIPNKHTQPDKRRRHSETQGNGSSRAFCF